MTASNIRFDNLDVLRGIAAISVVVQHYTTSAGIMNDLSYFSFGKFGVVLFFLISGFLIPNSLSHRNEKPIMSFLVSRFFRLYPIYWVSIIFFVLTSITLNNDFDTLTVLINFTMFQKFIGVRDVIGVYWTLFIEMCFYIICVASFKFSINNHINRFYYGIAFLLLSFIQGVVRFYLEVKMPVALTMGLSMMFFASCLRDIVDGEESKYGALFVLCYLVLFPIICYFAYSADFGYKENPYKYFFSYTVALVIFLFSLKCKLDTKSSPVVVKKAFSLFSFFGLISYSLYLFHVLFLKLYEKMFHGHLDNPIVILSFFFVNIAVSWGLYEVVEKQGVLMGKSIRCKLRSSAHANSQA